MKDTDDRFEEAIDELGRRLDGIVDDAKNWFADFVLGERGPRDWEAGCRQPTPEEKAVFQEKLAVALKRWEERKAAEREAAEREGAKKGSVR